MPAGDVRQFLSANVSAHIAHETRRIASFMRLTPVNTPFCSPQSNSMAESFINTFKREYPSHMDFSDVQSALAELPAVLEQFNEA